MGFFFVILIQSRNFKWGSHLEQVKEQEQQQSLNAQLFGMSYMDHHWLIGCDNDNSITKSYGVYPQTEAQEVEKLQGDT